MGWLGDKLLLVALSVALAASPALAWDNGGKTRTKTRPAYGTHDWIAEQALQFLPLEERVLIETHRNAYLLGTGAPDNKSEAVKAVGKQLAQGYGDKRRHNNCYTEDGQILIDSWTGTPQDFASRRAQEEAEKCRVALRQGNYELAAFYAGTTTHYISDLANWAHVISFYSLYPAEDPLRHAEFERSVEKTIAYNTETRTYGSTTFSAHISFDGELEIMNAYDASLRVGWQTHCGETYSCTQMQDSLPMGKHGNGGYVDCDNWSSAYKQETGHALNRAVNAIAAVLHTIYRPPAPDNVLTTQDAGD